MDFGRITIEMEGKIIFKKEDGLHKQNEKKEIHRIQRYIQYKKGCLLILTCAVLSFTNYYSSVYLAENINLNQNILWIDGKAKDEHNPLMLETFQVPTHSPACRLHHCRFQPINGTTKTAADNYQVAYQNMIK